MTNTTITLSEKISLFEAFKEIDDRLQNIGASWILRVDMTQVRFAITRDVFFVMAKRFKGKQIELVLSHPHEVEMARSVHLQALLSNTSIDFEREFEKKNILKHNFTMREYFLYELKRWWEYIKFVFHRTPKENKKHIYKAKTATPNMILIVSGLIMSLTLLLFIFHFAVSKTYVYITPQISVRPISSNIIFTDGTGGLLTAKNTVRMKRVSFPIEHVMKFSLDTIDPNSATSAQGMVTLYNELSQAQTLKPNTRFITDDGVVFRSDAWVNIPAAKTINGITEIGVAEVLVRADQKDEAGKIIGIRGNIPTATLLTIPGLKFNRDKVYAKTKADFVGGSDPKIHIVTEAEVSKFTGILREQLYRTARSSLQIRLDDENQKNRENYTLLMGDAVTFSGELIRITSGQKIGDLANEVQMEGSLVVTALVYDKNMVVQYLTTIFRDKLLYGTDKELGIHEDTLRLTNVIQRSQNDGSIKATMEMNATITYDLENATNELTRRMKSMITGLPKNDAITKIINEWHVREVDIRFSPFWMRTVSSNPDNIEFVIREE